MELSPEDKKAVLDTVAANISRQIILGGGACLTDLVLLPMGVAEKMLGLDARTIKKHVPWQDFGPKKHRVKLSAVQAFIEEKTVAPERRTA